MRKTITFFTMLILSIGVGWADTSTLTFTKACGGSGTADDGVVWTVTSDAAESTYDGTKGIHYGTGSAAVSYLTLTTSGIGGTITQVKVNASGASGTSAKLNVTVGGAAFGSQQSLSATATDYTFTGSASGQIAVTVSQTSAKRALYVKSIEVTYTSTVAPPTFSGVENNATSNTNVTLTMATATTGASIHYTKRAVDDQTVSTSDLTSNYSSPITYSEDGNYVIYAAAYKGGQWSAISSIHFTIDKQSAPTPSGDYELVTDASKLTAGDLIIITSSKANGDAYAMGPQNGKYRSVSAISVDRNTTSPGDDTQILTLKGESDAWQFETENGYLYASSSTSNDIATGTLSDAGNNANATIALNADTHEATIVFQGSNTRNQLRYNYNGGSNIRFSCYNSNSTLPLVYIFRKKTEPPLTTVTGLSELKQQEPGTTVRLSLPDDCNARVLTVHGTDTYVRDNSGAIVFHGDILPTRDLQYNQHLAGWIVGKYTVNATSGLPQFEPVEGKTNTAFLVIADPVTEATTTAKAITADEYNDHLADWVTVNDLRVGADDYTIVDGLEQGITVPYDGALVDVNAIVAGDDTFYPTDQSVTYVVDAKQEFVKPDANLEGVPVRYKRTFQADTWTPLTLPFDLDDFDGKVMEFSGLEQGEPVTGALSGWEYAAGNMLFTHASTIEAGKPYLVKPNNDITVMTFGSTTLSSKEPVCVVHTIAGTASNAPRRVSSVGDNDEYSFVGVYTPTTLSTDHTQRFMDEAGGVAWVEGESVTIDGTTAYFEAPANQGIHLKFADDQTESIITVIDDLTRDQAVSRPEGIYNLLGVKMRQSWADLPRGIYIVNGKKVVK